MRIKIAGMSKHAEVDQAYQVENLILFVRKSRKRNLSLSMFFISFPYANLFNI